VKSIPDDRVEIPAHRVGHRVQLKDGAFGSETERVGTVIGIGFYYEVEFPSGYVMNLLDREIIRATNGVEVFMETL
jgi:hypothetical protein